MTRYGRTQFADPNKDQDAAKKQKEEKKKTESSGWGSDNDDKKEESDNEDNGGVVDLDHDHRMLLEKSAPLLKSRNSGVKNID